MRDFDHLAHVNAAVTLNINSHIATQTGSPFQRDNARYADEEVEGGNRPLSGTLKVLEEQTRHGY